MDIWHFIERDHANIAHLIHEMPAALPGSGVLRSRGRLLADLIDEIDLHAAALGGGLYPVLRRDPATARLLDELARDEADFVRALRGLQRRLNARDWLDRFSDASYAVDQWLHRHRHELVPAAHARLFGPDLQRATDGFIRARRRVLQEQDAGTRAGSLVAAGAAIALSSALALLVWRYVVPARPNGTRAPAPRRGLARGQPHADRAAAAAPEPRRQDEDLRERQERLLDEAIEETFPASDPISPTRITR